MIVNRRFPFSPFFLFLCIFVSFCSFIFFLSFFVPARFHRREASLPRILSPIGFAMHRRACYDDIDVDYEFYTTTDEHERQPIKPVPIWLCVFLVVSYILGGACLFSKWEKWTFLDSAYFCFITLTTIGM